MGRELGWIAVVVALAVASPAVAEPCATQKGFAIVVHGGTLDETIADGGRTDVIRKVLEAGRKQLRKGGSALDVVERAVATLEDSGVFNAGRGSNANAGGFIETDASIVSGVDRRAGSVASMRLIRNPISAARLLLEKSRPVMVVGDRGEAYVRSLGAETVAPDYFIKQRVIDPAQPPHGTVGAVALDRCGAIAAGTSTGGFGAKVPGRVGDSPIVGAGSFADDMVGFSSTGLGEYFIRYSVPKDIADRMRYAGAPMRAAADAVIVDQLGALKAEAGLIGINRSGEVLMTYNAIGMSRGYATHEEAPVALMYEGSRGNAP